MHSLQLELAEQRGGIQFAESRDFVPDRGAVAQRPQQCGPDLVGAELCPARLLGARRERERGYRHGYQVRGHLACLQLADIVAKGLFAQVIKNFAGCRRDFRVKMGVFFESPARSGGQGSAGSPCMSGHALENRPTRTAPARSSAWARVMTIA